MLLESITGKQQPNMACSLKKLNDEIKTRIFRFRLTEGMLMLMPKKSVTESITVKEGEGKTSRVTKITDLKCA